MSAKKNILDRIDQHPHQVWTPVDFYDLGSRDIIDKTLQRLTNKNELRRVDRGLYDKPRKNKLTKQLEAPDYRFVIQAVQRRDQIHVLLDGMTCANDLGLTNAVPGKVIVLTDARLRPIVLGNLTITFKLTAPSKLYWAERPAMHIIQSLYWLGDSIKNNCNLQKEFSQKIMMLLLGSEKKEEICGDLRNGLITLPIWMQNFVNNILFTIENTGTK